MIKMCNVRFSGRFGFVYKVFLIRAMFESFSVFLSFFNLRSRFPYNEKFISMFSNVIILWVLTLHMRGSMCVCVREREREGEREGEGENANAL